MRPLYRCGIRTSKKKYLHSVSSAQSLCKVRRKYRCVHVRNLFVDNQLMCVYVYNYNNNTTYTFLGES